MKSFRARILVLLAVASAVAAAGYHAEPAAEPEAAVVANPLVVKQPVARQPVIGGVVRLGPVRDRSFVYQPGAGVDLLIQADRQTIRRLRLAKEMIGRKDFVNAAEMLQKVLDQEKDAFYYPDPEKRDVLSSIRGAAERMIAAMPREGRDAYQLKYGGVAQGLLDDAIKEGRLDDLQGVVRRYFHCPAGYEATYRAGVLHQDRGQHLAAAMCFERLRELPDVAKKWEPTLSLRAALCLSRAGLAEKAGKALAAFHRLHGGGGVSLGGQHIGGFVKPGDGPAWLAKNFPGASSRDVRETEWVLFRGNRQRNGIAPLPKKPDDVSWRMSTIIDPLHETADLDEKNPTENLKLLRGLASKIIEKNRSLSEPLPPSAYPLVIDDMLVFRTLDFIRAVDAKTGSRIWETLGDFRLDGMLTLDSGTVSDRLGTLLEQRLLHDLTHGTMSSDGEWLYAVEDSGYAFFRETGLGAGNRRYLPPHDGNHLVAYDLRTGRVDWAFGGPAGVSDSDQDILSGTYFLGAPLPLGGRVYCLAETNGEIRLLAFERKRSKPERRASDHVELVWSQPLVGANLRIVQNPARRMSAAAVSYADGILVCNTDAGYVIGVNVTSQSLLWAYRYGTASRLPVPGPFPRPAPFPPLVRNNWYDGAPAIADGKVLLTPRGSNEIHCLNLVDGTVAWKKPQGDGRYVVGIIDANALVVGSGSVRALALQDGKDAWKRPAKIANLSGRGVIAGDRLFVPAGSDGVAVLDVKTGRVLGKAKLPGDRRPGNLVISGGTMISQGVDGVDVFPLPALKAK